MTTFSADNSYFSTQALIGSSGTTGNSKVTNTGLTVVGPLTAINMSYGPNAITSNVTTGSPLDITTKGLTFNSLAGSVGNLLLSAGTGVVPTWLAGATAGYYLASGGASASPVWTIFPTIPTSYTILRGSVVSPSGVTGSVTFSTAFSTAPYITLTVNTLTGSTTIIPVGLAGISTTAFTWVLGTALTTGQSIDWIAIQ